MHRELRKLLTHAIGVSEFVLAINLDIRDFSSFSKRVESPDVAIFIKKVYMKLIDDYFPDASFFKPTGDGLLIIISYNENNLAEIAKKTIDTCLNVLRDFGSFCMNDPMINFSVPQRIGIGLSRGTACRLVSENRVLDYSGRILNLASRLMDFARPSGIVFDDDFGIELLSDEQLKLFAKDSVYIRGISEREPIDIWYTKDFVSIPPTSRQPIEKVKWQKVRHSLTLKQIKERPAQFIHSLPSEPTDPTLVKVEIEYPGVVRGKRREEWLHLWDFDNFKYELEAGKPQVTIQYGALAKQLDKAGVKNSWNVKITIMYPEK